MLGFQAVVVSDDATGFRAEFIGFSGELGEEGQFRAGAHDEEEVGVVVKGVYAVGIGLDDSGEDGVCFFKVYSGFGLVMGRRGGLRGADLWSGSREALVVS